MHKSILDTIPQAVLLVLFAACLQGVAVLVGVALHFVRKGHKKNTHLGKATDDQPTPPTASRMSSNLSNRPDAALPDRWDAHLGAARIAFNATESRTQFDKLLGAHGVTCQPSLDALYETVSAEKEQR